jgi:hypothetical protein
VASAALLAFQKITNHRKHIFSGIKKTGEVGPGGFSNTLSAAPKNLLSNRNKGFELASFQKLWEN